MNLGTILLIAIGGAFAFEGVLWAIFPNGVRKTYSDAFSQMDDKALHISGLISVALGVGMIALGAKLVG
ncbi:MAG: DUF2065 domain-containing protein [Litorimonas sp.]